MPAGFVGSALPDIDRSVWRFRGSGDTERLWRCQTPAMRFRLATEADVAALARLRWRWRTIEGESDGDDSEAFDAFSERFIEFASEAISTRWTVWVAEDDDGEIVSNIWIYRVPKVPSPGRVSRDFGYMTNVYTAPHARNRGVGATLLSTVHSWAHDRDLELMIVWPSERSAPWYHRGGYTPSDDLYVLEVEGYEG